MWVEARASKDLGRHGPPHAGREGYDGWRARPATEHDSGSAVRVLTYDKAPSVPGLDGWGLVSKGAASSRIKPWMN